MATKWTNDDQTCQDVATKGLQWMLEHRICIHWHLLNGSYILAQRGTTTFFLHIQKGYLEEREIKVDDNSNQNRERDTWTA